MDLKLMENRLKLEKKKKMEHKFLGLQYSFLYVIVHEMYLFPRNKDFMLKCDSVLNLFI